MKKCFVSVFFVLVIFSSPAMGLVPENPQIQYENGLVSFSSSSVALDRFLMQLAQKASIQLYVIENLPAEKIELNFHLVPLENVLSNCLRDYNYAIIYSNESQENSGLFNYEKQKTFLFTESRSTGLSQTQSAGKTRLDARNSNMRPGFGYHDAGDPNRTLNTRTPDTRLIDEASTVRQHTFLQSSSTQRVSSPNSRSVSSNGQAVDSDQFDADLDDTAGQDRADDLTVSLENGSVLEEQKKIMKLGYCIQQLEDDINSGRAERQYNLWIEKKDPKFVYNPWVDLARMKTELQTFLSN